VLNAALARARTAGDFFRILPGHHLTNFDKFIGLEGERNQELFKATEATKNKRSGDEEVEKAAQEVIQRRGKNTNSYLVTYIQSLLRWKLNLTTNYPGKKP
jgi:hypothetical protein